MDDWAPKQPEGTFCPIIVGFDKLASVPEEQRWSNYCLSAWMA
jgi:hypothetical protein